MATTTTNYALVKPDLSDIVDIAQLNLNADKIDSELALRAPKASPTFSGTVTLPTTTSIGTVSSTELGYLDGVTSSIQTQLNNIIATGRIVSTVQTNNGTLATNSTQTFADTGLSASITPASSSNKILVIPSVFVGKSGGLTTAVELRVMRDTTVAYAVNDGITYGINSEIRGWLWGATLLDSPATTSSITYKVQFRQPTAGGGTAWANVGVGSGYSRLLLIEVTP